MRRNLAILITLTLSLTMMSCGGMEEDEYRDAVPTRDQLAMTVPQGGSSGAQSGSLSQGLLGQRADLYSLTYKVSREVHGKIWIGLNVIESIVNHPPTTIQNGVATWGPHTGALEPLTWVLQVKKKGPGQYAYALSARKKADLNGKFVAILAGTSTKGTSKYFSGYTGVYTANATALHALDPITYPNTGKGVATYDTTGVKRTVEMALEDHSENGSPAADVLYKYIDRVDTSGEFRFATRSDLHKNGSAEEIFATVTVWNSQGAGQGKAVVSGGDMASGVNLEIDECWNSSFSRVFYQDNNPQNPIEGKASSCLFPVK